MDQLSPQDAQFLYLESPDNLTHLTSVSIFDQSTVPGGEVVRFKDILAHVEGRLHMSPLFKRRLVHVPLELDFPYWVDDEHFRLERHVRVVEQHLAQALAEARVAGLDLRQVLDLLHLNGSTIMDYTRPPDGIKVRPLPGLHFDLLADGSIEVGKRADLAIWQVGLPAQQPVLDHIQFLVKGCICFFLLFFQGFFCGLRAHPPEIPFRDLRSSKYFQLFIRADCRSH